MHLNQSAFKHIISIHLFILVNSLLWFAGLHQLTGYIFFLFLLYFLYFIYDSYQQHFFLITALTIYFIFLSLGTVATSWDARSIWLFHGKRIFIDNNALTQLDDYMPWSHNDYPIIVPLVSASFAKMVGFCNEIFPKTSNIIFLISPLLTIYLWLNNKRLFVFFAIGINYILGKLILNGYMYANLSINSLSTFLLVYYSLEYKNKWFLSFAFFLNSIILVHIKNEGVVIYFLILIALVLVNFKDIKVLLKKSLLLLTPFLTVFLWRIVVTQHNVFNDLQSGISKHDGVNTHEFSLGSGLQQILMARLNYENMTMIAEHIFLHKYYLFCLIPILVHLKTKEKLFDNFMFAVCILILSLFGFLFAVYLLTPHDLFWHLKTSATRTTLVIQMLCFLMAIYSIKKYINFHEKHRD